MSVNEAQKDFWSGGGGDVWVAQQEALDIMLGPLGDMAMARLMVASGSHGLDIGCGTGTTTLALAEKVGKDGSILGADISAPMLALAESRASSAGLTQVSFTEGDMQVVQPEGAPFDFVFSRFGVMFFEDPHAAFQNIHECLKPSGQFTFVCWQSPAQNLWTSVAMGAIGKFVELPQAPSPRMPGPFSFQEEGHIGDILAKANFNEIAIEGHSGDLTLFPGQELATSVSAYFEINPAVKMLIAQEPEAKQVQIRQAAVEAFTPFYQKDRLVFPGAWWVVSATA